MHTESPGVAFIVMRNGQKIIYENTTTNHGGSWETMKFADFVKLSPVHGSHGDFCCKSLLT